MEKKFEISNKNYNLLLAIFFYCKYLFHGNRNWSVFSEGKSMVYTRKLGLTSGGELMSLNSAMQTGFSCHDAFTIYDLIETRSGMESALPYSGRRATLDMMFDGINEMIKNGEIVIKD
jgi:hypothetical protein